MYRNIFDQNCSSQKSAANSIKMVSGERGLNFSRLAKKFYTEKEVIESGESAGRLSYYHTLCREHSLIKEGPGKKVSLESIINCKTFRWRLMRTPIICYEIKRACGSCTDEHIFSILR